MSFVSSIKGVHDMRLLDIFKKRKSNILQMPKLFTDEDFDRVFKVVYINGVNDNFAEVYLKTEKEYESNNPTTTKKSDIIILPFSKGVQEFCINRKMPIVMSSKVNLGLITFFLPYLKSKGVSDILVDAFEACWYPGNNLPINKPIYDKDGKRIGYKPRGRLMYDKRWRRLHGKNKSQYCLRI